MRSRSAALLCAMASWSRSSPAAVGAQIAPLADDEIIFAVRVLLTSYPSAKSGKHELTMRAVCSRVHAMLRNGCWMADSRSVLPN
jgi:hypothetical protein